MRLNTKYKMQLAFNLLRRSTKKILRVKRKDFLCISNIECFKGIGIVGVRSHSKRISEYIRLIGSNGIVMINDVYNNIQQLGMTEKITLTIPKISELQEPFIFKEKRDHKQERYRANQYRK